MSQTPPLSMPNANPGYSYPDSSATKAGLGGAKGGVMANTPQPSSVEALQRENAKLRKINQVLMDRVERSMDHQGNAYTLFQTAIALENRVRERTQALGQAMRDLEKSNREQTHAKIEADTARMRLTEAIEAISDGFLLCNAKGSIVVFNTKFKALWPPLAGLIQPGTAFADVLDAMDEAGLVRPEDVARLRETSNPAKGGTDHEPLVIQMTNGTWLRISERPTRDGGLVGIYADITEIKLAEQRQREAALAEKSAILQATLDNITQGISVFDKDHTLVATNRQFTELLDIDESAVPLGTELKSLADHPALHHQLSAEADQQGMEAVTELAPSPLPLKPDSPTRLHGSSLTDHLRRPAVIEYAGSEGRTLEIRRNPMPDGGFVSTYTDITERTRAAEALRDSEQRLRLITDAMPALIAYVDRERRYRFTNRAYEDWFGRPRSEINGKTMAEALAPDLYEKRRAFVDLALRGEFVTFEMRLPTGKSSIEYAHATYVPHFDEDGRVLGFFALIQDATERKRAARNLQEAKENLERRVEERTAALLDLNEALRRAKGEAENANLSKTKFLAAASHDLLQPLNAARVFAGALAERDLPDKEQRILGHLTTSLEAVDDLLSSLLEISRLEAGVLHPEFRDFAVGPLLQSLAAEHAPLAISKGLRFKVFSPPVYSHSDPKLVGRVLRNFLSNALRYTDQGGILLGCRRQKDSLIIGVWDTGQGIPEDKLTEIFEEFRRLKADRGGMTDNGVGLGLAIVERIAQGLDQDLKVRSKLGKGSFFGLRLPIIDSPDIPEPSPQPAPPRSSAVQGSNILVLDNETTIVAGMRVLLEGWGCQVVTATSLQAIEIYCKNTATPPDLVIADYHLDEGQIGLQALEILETRWGAGTVPSLIVTADHTPEVAQDVAARGAELMTKPVRPARLRAMLAHLLAKQT